MSTPDFETLLQSPFDDEEKEGHRGAALVGGVVLGIVLVGGFAVITSANDQPTLPATTVVHAPAVDSEPPVARAPDPFPLGFVQISENLSAHPLEIIDLGDRYLVSFTTATRRGVDPEATEAPLGGRWHLTSDTGDTVVPTRTIYDRFRPGIFALEFDRLPDGTVAGLRMVERWDPVTTTVSVDTPFSDTPFSIEEPLTVAVGDDATLIIEELELGRFLGSVVWSIQGDGSPRGIADLQVALMDTDDARRGSYGSFPPSRDPLPAGEALDLFWEETFPIDQDGAVRVEIEVTVSLVQPAVVDATFTDLPLIE